MKIHNEYAQNSLEWLVARAGIPTASEFHNLLTPKFEIRTGEMPKSYLARKLAERWLGGPLPGYTSIDMDLGKILEEEAKPFYELQYGHEITNVGFVTTDDGKIGCSPDGLIGEDGGLELKSPEAHTHVSYLLKGVVPPDYVTQVYGSMYVTDRAWWRFMSYRRRFPHLMIQVNRDEDIMGTIGECLGEFCAKLDDAYNRLCELNGGPPKRFQRVTSGDELDEQQMNRGPVDALDMPFPEEAIGITP